MSKKEKKSLRKNKQLNGYEKKVQEKQIEKHESDVALVKEIVEQLEQYNILEIWIQSFLSNKTLTARESRKLGQSTFRQLRQAYKKWLTNRDNREEELTTEDNYGPKLHHLIRFVMSISSKSQILLSILRDTDSQKAHIRDNGTFLALAVGEFFPEKVLTGDAWLDICDDIEDEYDVDNKDMEFIELIRKFFNTQSDEKKTNSLYSLEDVVTSSEDIENYYYDTQKQWTLDLITKHQSDMDTVNANLPMNLWHAWNYYVQCVKGSDEYWEEFCGHELMKKYDDGSGLHLGISKFPKNDLMGSYNKEANKGRARKFIPFFITYCVANYCKSVDEIKEAQQMILKFNSFTNKKVKKYWTKMFKRMVLNTSMSEMISFYEDEYKHVMENIDWHKIGNSVTSIKHSKHNGQRINAWADLTHKKYDQAIWFVGVVLYFSFNSKKTKESVITRFVDTYVDRLEGIVLDGQKQIPTSTYFGESAAKYKSNNAEARFDKIFEPVVDNIDKWIKNSKKDRTDESKFRKKVLGKFDAFVSDTRVNPILTLYPLSIDDLKTINLATGDGLHWLHTNDKDNVAKDGFLGMIDDNLKGNLKYKTWPKNYQNEYIKSLLEHNKEMYEKNPNFTLGQSIITLEQMTKRDFSL